MRGFYGVWMNAVCWEKLSWVECLFGGCLMLDSCGRSVCPFLFDTCPFR